MVKVADQPRAVSKSVDEFLRVLAEALVIVLAVSFLSLGLHTKPLRIDTGPGLDPAWLDDAPPGGGLGLGIVRRCARLMQAPLSLRSTPGRGSSFRLVLPRLTPAALSRASSS